MVATGLGEAYAYNRCDIAGLYSLDGELSRYSRAET
jgi:hypothetical protein